MSIIGMILLAIGGITVVVGAILFLIAAFRESILWGLGSILVPFVSLIFLIMHWNEAKRGFLIKLLGVLIAGGGLFILAMSSKHV